MANHIAGCFYQLKVTHFYNNEMSENTVAGFQNISRTVNKKSKHAAKV